MLRNVPLLSERNNNKKKKSPWLDEETVEEVVMKSGRKDI